MNEKKLLKLAVEEATSRRYNKDAKGLYAAGRLFFFGGSLEGARECVELAAKHGVEGSKKLLDTLRELDDNQYQKIRSGIIGSKIVKKLKKSAEYGKAVDAFKEESGAPREILDLIEYLTSSRSELGRAILVLNKR